VIIVADQAKGRVELCCAAFATWLGFEKRLGKRFSS
jgi:hypothetical protein